MAGPPEGSESPVPRGCVSLHLELFTHGRFMHAYLAHIGNSKGKAKFGRNAVSLSEIQMQPLKVSTNVR